MHLLYIFISLFSISLSMSVRKPKNLPYFDYLTPEEYDYDMAVTVDQNDLSRTIPKRKPLNPYDSPIYYIRLPPQPYMFVPGLGYISQPPPPPPPMSPFMTLPINFVANGKPTNIYQWASGVDGFEEPRPQKVPTKPPKVPMKPQKPDSTIHNLDGQFTFNGKPENVLILRDSYNSLYGDALQNFYP